MKHLLITLALIGLGLGSVRSAQAQGTPAGTIKRYRVSLTDKNGTPYSLLKPEKFLSPKALERRARYGIRPDSLDLPVNPAYVRRLQEKGLRIVNRSKWNNTVVVETADSTLARSLTSLPFVKAVRCVWIKPERSMSDTPEDERHTLINDTNSVRTDDYYGMAQEQVEQIGANRLHDLGYRGRGVTIAVIDGGFLNADAIAGLKGVDILGTRNFVDPSRPVYEQNNHGTKVLACIAAHAPHQLVGTAPEASFYLIQTEDGRTEQLIEEDNWAAGIEYADSVGCDVVTSSLGYNAFDHAEMNHRYRDLDGHTPLISHSASLAASRGILAIGSAGNSGLDRWKKITSPADASDFLTVGAVDEQGRNTYFSSIGHTADGRIKPDVMARGEEAWLYDEAGQISTANGTSFACPIMCGGAACLVQAFPHARPETIIRAIQQSGNNADGPDNIFGYGIPALSKAYQILANGAK